MKNSFTNARGLVIRIKNWNFRKTFKEAQENATKARIEIQKPRQLNKINLIIFKIPASARSTASGADPADKNPDIRVFKPPPARAKTRSTKTRMSGVSTKSSPRKKSARMADFPGFQGESPDCRTQTRGRSHPISPR